MGDDFGFVNAVGLVVLVFGAGLFNYSKYQKMVEKDKMLTRTPGEATVACMEVLQGETWKCTSYAIWVKSVCILGTCLAERCSFRLRSTALPTRFTSFLGWNERALQLPDFLVRWHFLQ